MLEEEAAAPRADLEHLLGGEALSGLHDQRLTAAFIDRLPFDAACGGGPVDASVVRSQALDVEVSRSDSERLLNCLVSKGGDQASLLWREHITQVMISEGGMVRSGTVRFTREGCFSGTLPFEVTRTDRGWKVTRLELPDSGVSVSEAVGGRWAATTRPGPPLPDFGSISNEEACFLRLEPGEELIATLNGVHVDAHEIAGLLPGRPVVLRPLAETHFAAVRELAIALASEIPAPTVVGWALNRHIGTCWSLLGSTEEQPHWLARSRHWVSAAQPVHRRSFGGRIVEVCVDQDGCRIAMDGTMLGMALDDYDLFHGAVQILPAGLDSRAAVLRCGDEMPWRRVEMALDWLERGEITRVFLPIDGDFGMALQLRECTSVAHEALPVSGRSSSRRDAREYPSPSAPVTHHRQRAVDGLVWGTRPRPHSAAGGELLRFNIDGT